jgi:hypothetical protein
VAVAAGDVAVAEGDVEQPAESPITAHIGAAAMIQLFLFDSNRRTPATDGPDVALMVGLRENMETTSSVRWEYEKSRESR